MPFIYAFMHMRTTVHIDDLIFELAKKKAAERKVPLRKIIEESLRSFLMRPKAQSKKDVFSLKWPVARGRLLPGVDISDRDSLFSKMEESD